MSHRALPHRALPHRALALLALLALTACDHEDPRPGAFGGELAPVTGKADFFEKFVLHIITPEGTGLTAAAFEAQAVRMVGQARTELIAAFARFESEALAEALIAARDRGVEVQVAGDQDARGDRGFRALLTAGVPVVFGNGPMVWSPQPGLDVRRLGSQNRMTHSMIIADGLRLIAATGGFFDPADPATETRWQVGFSAVGEIFCKDFRHTLKQLVAGTFATTLTLFGAITSADGNNRTFYPVEDGVVEAYYGPQEPLAKHTIDEIYAARASVWIAGERFSNEALLDAVRYKIEAGFDVRILVAPGARGERYCFPAPRADCCERPDDPQCDNRFEAVGLVGELEGALEALEAAGRAGVRDILRERAGPTGTVVILDAVRSPINDRKYAGQALISSQPLASTVAFGSATLPDGSFPGRPSDLFTDGQMVVVRENNANPGTGDFPAAVAWFEALWEAQ